MTPFPPRFAHQGPHARMPPFAIPQTETILAAHPVMTPSCKLRFSILIYQKPSTCQGNSSCERATNLRIRQNTYKYVSLERRVRIDVDGRGLSNAAPEGGQAVLVVPDQVVQILPRCPKPQGLAADLPGHLCVVKLEPRDAIGAHLAGREGQQPAWRQTRRASRHSPYHQHPCHWHPQTRQGAASWTEQGHTERTSETLWTSDS